MGEPSRLKEHVMVFPTSLLLEVGPFQGINLNYKKFVNMITPKYKFYERELAEFDKTLKQVIPYVLLRYRNQFFSYKRGKLLSEKRLLGNCSIGVGGHISIEDETLFGSSYKEGMLRELNEEVQINSNYQNHIVAVLNDDSNEVGSVHFGIVHILDLESPDVAKKEKSINEPQFKSIEALNQDLDQYENWSQICIRNISQLVNNIE